MNYRIILHTLGWVLNIEAVTMLLPLLCSVLYGESCSVDFAVCIILCAVLGIALTIKSPGKKAMYAKEGFVGVALSWIFLSVFGALPFFISGYIPNFADAVFETVSGFTTTGASILRDVEALPKGLIFWRSFTHWMGGMGVLVFIVAILPLAGGNNIYLVKAESPGPSVGKLVPKIRSSAKILYVMYIVLTAIQVILLLCVGLSLFEALTLSFGTAGTGGFGIVNSSIADYSPFVQNTITVFMILFGIDFSLYYMILLGKFREVIRSEELRAYLGIIAAAVIVIIINCGNIFASFGEALRHAAFQVASIITTTGYSTADFDRWPELSKTVLLVLMFIGACAGSTGGGIKVSRIMILFKSFIKEIKIAAHPNSTHRIRMNGRVVEHEVVRGVNAFMAAYICVYVVSLLIVSIDNFDILTNISAIAATLNNIGPGLSKVGPVCNFADFSILSKVVMTLDMLIGRLEIFPILVLFSPYTWRK